MFQNLDPFLYSYFSYFISLNIGNILHSQFNFSSNYFIISSSLAYDSLIVDLSAVSHLSLNFIINLIIWFLYHPQWDKPGLLKVPGIETIPWDHFSYCCHVFIDFISLGQVMPSVYMLWVLVLHECSLKTLPYATLDTCLLLFRIWCSNPTQAVEKRYLTY